MESINSSFLLFVLEGVVKQLDPPLSVLRTLMKTYSGLSSPTQLECQNLFMEPEKVFCSRPNHNLKFTTGPGKIFILPGQ